MRLRLCDFIPRMWSEDLTDWASIRHTHSRIAGRTYCRHFGEGEGKDHFSPGMKERVKYKMASFGPAVQQIV